MLLWILALWGFSANADFCMQNFNAYGPAYASGISSRTERWSQEIQKDACAVVHLQEVWSESHINQVEQTLRSDYQMTTPNRKARVGVMSLFKGNLLGQETYRFRKNSDGGVFDSVRGVFGVKKAFHIVRARPEGADEDIYFLNTHLHPMSTAVRVSQILDLFNWRLQSQDAKLIMSGDFNAGVRSLERALVLVLMGMKDSFEEGHGYLPGLCTYCEKNPLSWGGGDRVIDYIFYSEVGGAYSHFRVTEASINLKGSERKPLSDHYGVKVQLALIPGKANDHRPSSYGHLVPVLEHALKVLRDENDSDYDADIAELQSLIRQAQRNSGPWIDYLNQ